MAKTLPSEKTPSADDEAKQQNELPMMPTTMAPKDTGTPKEAADPLAKWREAREMEEEMSDLFDEDRVTHQQGGTEPEAD